MGLKLVVGLGNPGDKYRGTRHNAGADFVEEVARRYGVSLSAESRFFGLAGRVQAEGMDFRLLVPTTYMNHSGRAVQAMASFYKLEPAEILVAHDELDFEPGVARLKEGGGHGGHNGLRDICQVIGNDYPRLRIGIGHPGNARDVSDYVLSRPSPDDRERIAQGIDESARIVPTLVAGDWTKAVRELHTATKPTDTTEDGI